MTWKNSTILTVTALVLAEPLLAQQNALENAKVVALDDWRYDDLYTYGVSARDLIDREVYGQTGD